MEGVFRAPSGCALFVDNKFYEAKGQLFEVIDPSTEEVIAKLHSCDKAEVDLAVTSAAKAFESWKETPVAERCEYLKKIAAGVKANAEKLAWVETLCSGKPYKECLADMGDVSATFEYYADLALKKLDQKNGFLYNKTRDAPEVPPEFAGEVVSEPVGVIAAICPFNFPLLIATWKIAPALAAGCTVVVKPSELTPLSALELCFICQEVGLPAGVLNCVVGWREVTGQPLISHPLVDKISFTGSSFTGSKIMATAACRISRVGMELGGKSSCVVFSDAVTPTASTTKAQLIDALVDWICFGFAWTNGQICSATSRLLLQQDIADEVIKRLVQVTNNIEAIVTSDINNKDKGNCYGPVVSKQQQQKILAMIAEAKQQGVKQLCGEGFDGNNKKTKGWYIKPTIFLLDNNSNANIWNQEVFGPVLCIKTFTTKEEALKIANDSDFGLAAAVFTFDDTVFQFMAKKLRVGILWRNCSQPTFISCPWGGFKKSGFGRELGEEGLWAFLDSKQIVTMKGEGNSWNWYIPPTQQ